MLSKAKDLAQQFNKYLLSMSHTFEGDDLFFYMRKPFLVRSLRDVSNGKGTVVIKAGEVVMLEQKIHLSFEKWNSNSSWINKQESLTALAQAFTH
eukprot:CAMPEP_0116900558 /NCGR_PEP_ID=MMETSP0467-20121206/8788_1 /TAXON_ID=283647 /ORGANISM="Mesodinium pulex, Strain SPMC105" /LENGTH=94 /DNA_ID=CAMNT_0004573821 /DNA_START=141 /DNA_END=425 /DNA_ORIENTATION=+